MRWLLVKDLQILRRSPLLVGLLVGYGLLVAVLIILARTGGPDKPRVAYLNQADQTTVSVGGDEIDAARYAERLFESVDPIRVDTREEALEKVRSGEALGAVIIPPDIGEKLQATLSLTGARDRPTIEVVYNVEDPIQGRYVEQVIKARLADANRALSERLTREGARYLEILLRGGSISLPFVGDIDVLGLQRSREILDDLARSLPEGSERRREVERVAQFAGLAVENLDLSDEILAAISQPVQIDRTVLEQADTPVDVYVVAIAAAVSVMFVCLLLAAGMLALEREEHAYGRLVRGLVSRLALLAEKVTLAAAAATAVGLLMLVLVGLFVALDWAAFPLWLVALAGASVAFGALGVLVGALTRDVRAASLAAFLIGPPMALLALVPSNTVSPGLHDAIEGVSAAFPFAPALDALDVALTGAGGSLLVPLVHLLGLAAVFTALSRLALRRFG